MIAQPTLVSRGESHPSGTRRVRCRTPPPPWARWAAARAEQGGVAPTEPLRHRLRERVGAWKSAGAGQKVLQWAEDPLLREGVPISWRAGPPPAFHKGVSCEGVDGAQRAFLVEELDRLERAGAIHRVPDRGAHVNHVTRMFMVPKPPARDKWRLVLDLRHLNSFCVDRKVRFETLKSLRRMVRPDDWMFSFDLKDGYHAIGIHPRDRKYFTFVVEGVGTFQYCALNFGWNASPYVFVKVMRTLVRALRSPTPEGSHNPLHSQFPALVETGMRVLPYMDDFLGLCGSRESALTARAYAEAVLDHLGLSRNLDKGQWEPVQRAEHLAVGKDTAGSLFYVPPAKLTRITRMTQGLLWYQYP